MSRFPSRTLQRHLSRLAKLRQDYIAPYCQHLQDLPNVYHIDQAITALDGLVEAKVIPVESRLTDKGRVPFLSVEPTPGKETIMHGLNVLLWEQAIRRGELNSETRKKIRDLYTAILHFHQPSANEDGPHRFERVRKRERALQGAVLDLVESDQYADVREAVRKVSSDVFTALKKRSNSPHRQLMGLSLAEFDKFIDHLEDCHESRVDLRHAWRSGAKPL